MPPPLVTFVALWFASALYHPQPAFSTQPVARIPQTNPPPLLPFAFSLLPSPTPLRFQPILQLMPTYAYTARDGSGAAITARGI